MTWIRTVPPADADPELKRIYETLYGMYPPEYHTNVDAVTLRRDQRQRRGGAQPHSRSDAPHDGGAGGAAAAGPAADATAAGNGGDGDVGA